MAFGATVCVPLSGRLVGRGGPRLPLVLVRGFITVGGLCLVGLDQHTSVLLLLVAYSLIGVGFGFANAPITNTAMSGLPAGRADGTRTRVPPGLDPGRHLRTLPPPRGPRGTAEEG
jgi:MFS family permease